MFDKLKNTVKSQLTQGVSPQALALTCAMAFVLGTFPIIGMTTILCAVTGYFLKLNQPVLQVMNYLLTPIHLLLIPVFLRVGESLLHVPPTSISPAEMIELFRQDWRLFLVKYGIALLYAVFAWMILTPPAGWLVYKGLLPLFEKFKRIRS